jgi:hypothetical protein
VLRSFLRFVDVWATSDNIYGGRLVIVFAAAPFMALRQWIEPESKYFDVFGIAIIATMIGAWALWEWRRHVVRRELDLGEPFDG